MTTAAALDRARALLDQPAPGVPPGQLTVPHGPRIASLFSGTGALDVAVQEVFGGYVIWHSQYEPPDKKTGREDLNQFAAWILARHWPTTPNLGDITAICWQCVLDQYGPVDILTGGFPCTDVSSAGQRAGLLEGTRSGLWNHMARAIAVLRPRLVVIENVQGLLSSPADRGLELDEEALDEEAEAGRVLRALGAVLGDLATLGLDAEWVRLAASDVGAAHPRKRIFILAWPAAVDARGVGRGDGSRFLGRLGAAERDTTVQDAHVESCGQRRQPAPGQAEGGRPRADAGRRGGAPAADRQGTGLEGPGLPGRPAIHGRASADTHSDAVRQQPVGQPGRGSAAIAELAGSAAAPDTDGRAGRIQDGHHAERGRPGGAEQAGLGHRTAPDADALRRRADVLNLWPGEPDLDWGDYGPAIRRHERVFGRPAPWPTDALGRLSPVFTEWLMGLPDGWVTCTPGLNRNAMLKALGNGVVPRQAEAALRILAGRIGLDLVA